MLFLSFLIKQVLGFFEAVGGGCLWEQSILDGIRLFYMQTWWGNLCDFRVKYHFIHPVLKLWFFYGNLEIFSFPRLAFPLATSMPLSTSCLYLPRHPFCALKKMKIMTEMTVAIALKSTCCLRGWHWAQRSREAYCRGTGLGGESGWSKNTWNGRMLQVKRT